MSDLSPNVPAAALGPAHMGLASPAVYRQLSTDFYPWPEVVADLKARASKGQSFLFQAWQPSSNAAGGTEHWANFIWRDGTLLGGYTVGRELAFGAVMRALPRALVTLLPLSAAQAAQLWPMRSAEYLAKVQAGGQQWRAEAADIPENVAGRSGLLIGGEGGRWVTFWQNGAPIAGEWNAGLSTRSWYFVAAPPSLPRGELLELWQQVIALTSRQRNLDDAWKRAAMRLAEAHPVLDPFAREVAVRSGQLQVAAGVPADELRPALLDAYRYSLKILNLPFAALPLEEVSRHPLWEASGLSELGRPAASRTKENSE